MLSSVNWNFFSRCTLQAVGALVHNFYESNGNYYYQI